jgi:plastocyanin
MRVHRTASSRHSVVAPAATGLAVLAMTLAFSFTAFAGDIPDGDQDITCNGLVATIVKTDAAETINGTRGNDVIVGLGGRDTINGGPGHDTICGAEDDHLTLTGDVLNGGPGFDTLIGSAGPDEIHGGADIDVIYSVAFNTPSDGGARFPEMDEEGVRNVLDGGTGEDFLFSGTGGDNMNGNDGPDHLFGGGARDVMSGGADSDGFRDEIFGEGGNDFIVGGGGDDRGVGGGLIGGPGNDEIFGGLGVDFLQGDAGTDTLEGESRKDFIHGGDDHDELFGGGGEDNLFGEGGPDDHSGGPQDDFCEGGGDTGDTFVSCNEKKHKKKKPRGPKTHPVTIQGPPLACGPNPRIVRIHSGDTVIWTNKSGGNARITFETRFSGQSPVLPNNATFTLTFTVRTVGDFGYRATSTTCGANRGIVRMVRGD